MSFPGPRHTKLFSPPLSVSLTPPPRPLHVLLPPAATAPTLPLMIFTLFHRRLPRCHTGSLCAAFLTCTHAYTSVPVRKMSTAAVRVWGASPCFTRTTDMAEIGRSRDALDLLDSDVPALHTASRTSLRERVSWASEGSTAPHAGAVSVPDREWLLLLRPPSPTPSSPPVFHPPIPQWRCLSSPPRIH